MRSLLTTGYLLLTANLAIASNPLPDKGPIVPIRPDVRVTIAAADPINTASVPRIVRPGNARLILKKGLDALTKDDFSTLNKMRLSLPKGSVDRRILGWAHLYYAPSKLSAGDITAIAADLRGWPGASRIRQAAEIALAKSPPSANEVIGAFQAEPPKTIEGAIMLTEAYLAKGNKKGARAALEPWWRNKKLDAAIEVKIIKHFGSILPKAAHRERMERMLYHKRITSAQRVAGLAGATSLWRAWVAGERQQRDAPKLFSKVPANQHSAGYFYAKTRYLRRKEHFSNGAAFLGRHTMPVEQLLEPDIWWKERRVLARELLDIKKYSLAYEVAAAHQGGSILTQADAQFHAGWIALRFIGDAKTAAKHFAAIERIAKSPIVKARSAYWSGRAAEKLRNGQARQFFRTAAQYSTTYYGQLAASRLGIEKISIPYPSPSDNDRTTFSSRQLTIAIKHLIEAGHTRRASPIIEHLGRQLKSSGELALLTALAERANLDRNGLRVGKAAAYRGLNVGALTHPIGAVPKSAKISNAGKALAYAIARQESEFNVGAVSPVGAKGLLQLMPKTAQAVARRIGLEYSARRLVTDGGYNATLGAQYLSEQISRFDNSYILTFIAYNAGPSRADDWVKRYGNPKGRSIDDVVDWVERIPFAETRSYVQRVMENYQVYQTRLSGRFAIERDLRYGRPS